MYAKKSTFGKEKDIEFMKLALTQASNAYKHDEVPIGAVVVNAHGVVIGRGYNQVEKLHTQAAHAEVRALVQAGKKNKGWRLEGCWIYVTLEPCAMCISLIKLSRLEGIVYGPRSRLFGFHKIIDNDQLTSLYQKGLVIVEGIQAPESLSILKKFFQEKRGSGSGSEKKKRI